MSKVLGLDLSLTSSGVALVRAGELVKHTAIKSAKHPEAKREKRNETLVERHERMASIAERIAEFVRWEWHTLDLAVIEAPSFGSRHGSAHDRSGLWWWLVDDLISNFRVNVLTVAPKTRAKYITGDGNADKKLVLKVAREVYSPDIATDDEADAIGLAAMGSRHLGHPLEDEISKGQLMALEVATREDL